jgi:hypothetical protein
MLKRRKVNLWIYGLWPLIAVIGAIDMYLDPSAFTQTVWGVLALAVIIEALFRQHRELERERKELRIP